jgi:RNA polymerase sigma factor (sigma-70 family)
MNSPAAAVDEFLSGFGAAKERTGDMGQIARTDAQLVEASRRGERAAFGDLVSRYQDLVCAVSFSSTGNWALSEDVAQDTFLAAWRQLGQLRETGRVRPWLCTIARNLARKARQRNDREQEVDDDLPADAANPFDVTAQAEVDRVVREALARIPETYRETLVLYYCENRSVTEVADALGIAETAVMQRLTRGRRHLANGVTQLVERSLCSARSRKAIAGLVVAALPTALPSHVDASPRKGSNMPKLALATVLVTAAAGSAVAIVHSRSSASPPPAERNLAAARVTEPAPAPTRSTRSTTPAAAASAPRVPALPAASPRGDDHEPVVVASATIARLGLDRGPSRGPADAPVTIIVFQDLMCTYCSRVLGTIDQLWDEYPSKLRVVVKQFPVHSQARLAAEASFAADAQGKFWELHDLMIAHQDDLTRDALLAYGQQAGLDVGKLADALDHHTYAGALATEVAAAKEVGVTATPEFLINGRDFRGARPIEEFRAAIDAALADR